MKYLIFALLFVSCTKTVYVPIKEYIKGKDSIIIQKRDSIIYIDSPIQQQNVITNQKSCLSTDYSFSLAWVDTVGLLHHSIRNNAKIPLKIVYKDIYRVKRDTVYKSEVKLVDKIKEVTPLKAWLGWLILAIGIVWRVRKFFTI